MEKRTQTRGTFLARKAFRFHGRAYAPGQPFPWRKLSCSERKLATLINNRFVISEDEFEDSAKKAEAKAERREAAKTAVAAPKPVKETEPVKDESK